jgi:poly(3-hydroxybutyrate) depolymerase
VPPLDADLQMRSFDVNGTERTFWIPDRRPRGPEARLVMAFHERSQTGRKLGRKSKLHDPATAAGFNIIYPDALERVWDDHGTGRRDGADDDIFYTLLLEHLRRRGEIGEEPPLLIGYGENGGSFVERLAREGVHELAGAVLYGGTARAASRELTPAPVKPTRLIIANPPRAGSRRPGLRARLALNNVEGNALIGVDMLLTDWQQVNDPAGVETVLEPGAPEPWSLLARLIAEAAPDRPGA